LRRLTAKVKNSWEVGFTLSRRAKGYWLDGGENGLNSWQKKDILLFCTASRTAPAPNKGFIPEVRSPLIGLLYQTRMKYDDECKAVGGMMIVKGNGISRRKPALMSLSPPQTPHDVT
jgi:hypothetical protein